MTPQISYRGVRKDGTSFVGKMRIRPAVLAEARFHIGDRSLTIRDEDDVLVGEIFQFAGDGPRRWWSRDDDHPRGLVGGGEPVTVREFMRGGGLRKE